MDRILSRAFKTEEIEKLENEINNMVLEIKEKPIENIIIKEFTDDGIPTIETQLKEIELKDKEIENLVNENKDKIYKREMIQRVKCLCLIKMGKSIFTNTLDMKIKERNKLQALMWEYNDIDHKDIIKEFNEKIGDYMDEEEIDFSRVPIYQYR